MEHQQWEMNKQIDLQGGSASVLLQPNVLFNAAQCRREGWNRCQTSISHGFLPRCSSLCPRQALYCFFPCPLPFSDINNSFLLFLIRNKKEQQGRSAALPTAGLPGRQPVLCCRVATATASFHPEPTLLWLSLAQIRKPQRKTLRSFNSDLFLKSERLLPVLGISLTDPHCLPPLALSSRRAPAATESITSPWRASSLLQLLQAEHVFQHRRRRGESCSIREDGAHRREKDVGSMQGWTSRKRKKAWQASKQQHGSMIKRERDKPQWQKKTARNRIPESEMGLLWKHQHWKFGLGTTKGAFFLLRT